ncbi:ABC transporter substrate-binding protein [Blautia obeum]|uniref:Multiple sugar-binding protein n=1 Tax=Blautia obeum TaxID=40520 RepID=A0A564SCG7_9FIRM|nr:extracellular solute-binding protein [Blautia obeum]VUW92741.1 Multiple sugar-binding protein precursor [Blautia obeum]
MKKTKIVSSILCAAMVATLAANGVGVKEVKADSKEKTVTLFHHTGEEAGREVLADLISAFEKSNKGIKIEEQGIDFSQYDTMLKTKLAGGDAPDLIMGRPKMYADLIRAGHIEPLTDAEFLKNVEPETLESMKVDGDIYAVPTNQGGMGIFYNKKVFEDNDIEIPKSHEELMDVAKKLEDEGITPFAHGFQESWMAQCDLQSDLYGYTLQQNPTMFKDIMAGKKKFADYPDFKKCVQRTVDRLSFEGGDDFGTDASKARNMLINGEAAMLISGNWEISEFAEAGVDDQIGFFATPNTDDDQPVLGLAPDGCYMITAQSENVEEAKKFIEFLTTPEGAAIVNEKGYDIPCATNVDKTKLSPIVQDFIDIEENGKVYNYESEEIFSGQYDATFRKWQEELAVDTDRDVDDMIAELDDEIAAIQ